MVYQTNFNSYVAYGAQSALGTAKRGAGGTILRVTGGTPMHLAKAAIESKEVRRDAQHTRGRHGMQTVVGGPYTGEVSRDAYDSIYQALMRSTWDASFTGTSADFTTATITGANTITWTGGNPITKGFRVYDVIRLTASSTAGNNNKNLTIASISATAIVVNETLINAAADASMVIQRTGRKVIMPAAGSLVNTYFSIDEYEADIGVSRFAPDCFWKIGKWTMQPNNLLMFDPSFVGSGAFEIDTGVNAPVLTAPTLPTNPPMAVLDATLNIGGTVVADLTSFDLTLDNNAVAPQVAASKVSPTVLGGANTVAMNLKFLRKDSSWDADVLNETGLTLNMLAVANMSEPKDFLRISVPYFTLSDAQVSALSLAGGPRDVSLTIPAALVGHDTSGAGFDDTMLSLQISNSTSTS
jgi:hypothetical protein